MTRKIVTIGDTRTEVDLEREKGRFTDGKHELEIVAMTGDVAELRVDGRSYIVPFVVVDSQVSFAFDGEIYTADVADRSAPGRARHRDHSLSAPMPGMVLKLLVESGSVVEKGAPLVILEAMKMEHTIVAPRDGTVVAVNCREGEMVQPGVDLVELK